MKLNKWMMFGAMAGLTASTWAAGPTQEIRQLDIVIRDFQPNHSDFENFSEEAVAHLNDMYNYVSGAAPMNLFGYDLDWYSANNYHITCGNKESKSGALIGQDGLPKTPNLALPPYLQQTSLAPTLQYGECSNSTQPGVVQRGYKSVIGDVKGFVCSGNATRWENDVYYTPGMVQTYLQFDAPGDDGKIDMYDGVHINKLGEFCDNRNFAQWYADVPGVNKRMNATMDIPQDPAQPKYFVYDYNYNNGGYSPLDSVNPVTHEWVGQKACNAAIQPNGVCDQWGPQSLSIFCPPYKYQYAADQVDFLNDNTYGLCTAWLNYGGPRAVNPQGDGQSAAVKAVNQGFLAKNGTNLGFRHLRNYAFTMMGYASFKYKTSNQIPTPEVFEFAGDDDMWIYVDGVLAVDLGGNHLSAPGSVNIQTLAQFNHGCHAGEPLAGYSNCNGASDATGWADDTWHHLHFFYADRQTDGSNIYIRTSLAELAPSRYGQPTVGQAVVKVDEEGNVVNSLFLNTPIADSSIAYMVGGNADLAASGAAAGDYSALFNSGNPSIVVLRPDANGVLSAYGFYVTGMSGPTDKGANGFLYQFDGVMLGPDGQVVSSGLLGGDAIAFNFPYNSETSEDGRPAGFADATWAQMVAWNKKAQHYVTATSGKSVSGFDAYEDWALIDYTATAVLKVIEDNADPDRPQFKDQAAQLTNAAGSDGLPNDMTADMVITQVPAGISGDPISWATDNAEELMINSGSDNNNIGGATAIKRTTFGFAASQNPQDPNAQLCYSAGKTFNDQSCVNFAFVTTQPFRVNIRVFDHLGHFVSQYNKTMDRAQMAAALGAKTDVQGCNGKPMYGESGAALINLKMYPVAQSGRLLATGPYIYQVTIVKEADSYCYMSNGTSPTVMNMPYVRTTEVTTKGYRRGKAKKK